MSNFDKFSSALYEYIHNPLSIAFEKFQMEIENLDCEDFRFYYWRAYYLNRKNDISRAIKYIKKSIELANNLSNECGVENSHIIFVKKGESALPINLSSINNQLAKLYFCAGEIFAKAEDYNSSLQYYKLFQYYNSFIEKKFDNGTRFFSFRKFNEHTLSDLINNEITVCRSTAMNDPVDSLINIWIKDDNFRNQCKDKKHIEPFAKSFDYFRIRSFCYDKENENETVNNILMWSHYADEHRGFCIKYRLSEHFIKQEENPEHRHMYITKIHYAKDCEKINIQVHQINTKLGFATKSNDWEYENEARLIVYDPNNSQDYLGIGLDKDSTIEAIFFGYHCPESAITTIKNIFKNMYKDKPVKFYKMNVNHKDVYHFTYDNI